MVSLSCHSCISHFCAASCAKKINMPSLTKGQETWCSPIFSMNLKWFCCSYSVQFMAEKCILRWRKNPQWNELYKFRAEVLPYSIITIYLEDSDILIQCAQYNQLFTRHIFSWWRLKCILYMKEMYTIYDNSLTHMFNLGFGDFFSNFSFTCETCESSYWTNALSYNTKKKYPSAYWAITLVNWFKIFTSSFTAAEVHYVWK